MWFIIEVKLINKNTVAQGIFLEAMIYLIPLFDEKHNNIKTVVLSSK